MLGLVLAGCADDGGGGLVLDGSVFGADDAGIVDDVSPSSITIDGVERPLADEIVVFSAASLARVDLAPRAGQYVQVGIDGDTVQWVASVGAVLPGDAPVVLFEGTAAEVGDQQVTFVSGLQLALADGVEVSADGVTVVRIDPTTDEIVGVER